MVPVRGWTRVSENAQRRSRRARRTGCMSGPRRPPTPTTSRETGRVASSSKAPAAAAMTTPMHATTTTTAATMHNLAGVPRRANQSDAEATEDAGLVFSFALSDLNERLLKFCIVLPRPTRPPYSPNAKRHLHIAGGTWCHLPPPHPSPTATNWKARSRQVRRKPFRSAASRATGRQKPSPGSTDTGFHCCRRAPRSLRMRAPVAATAGGTRHRRGRRVRCRARRLQ